MIQYVIVSISKVRQVKSWSFPDLSVIFLWLLAFCVFQFFMLSLTFFSVLCFVCPLSPVWTLLVVPISTCGRPHSFHSGSFPAGGLEVFSPYTPSTGVFTPSLSSSPSDPFIHPPTFSTTTRTGILPYYHNINIWICIHYMINTVYVIRTTNSFWHQNQ